MERYLAEHIRKDLKEKIVLLSGPRQVGKATLARQLTSAHVYLNFDAATDRRILQAQEWDRDSELVVFDELHKLKRWKS
ncbi:MAG: AAA family ATPase [Desulfobacteraceae bacterium]|nr:AAA family ATPase [Desulfobacteraceae bacterium]